MKMPWTKSQPEAEVPASPIVDHHGPRTATDPKGKPTPKRQRRQPVAPPPTTGKEARQRMRERDQQRKAAGLPPEKRTPSPREERILARDAGPERELVRNIVDTRYSISSIFPLFAILILVAMFSGLATTNPEVYNYLSYAWLAFFVVIIFESIVLGRKIGALVRERFPKTTLRMGSLRYYGIIRGLMFRRLRYPKPVVKPGDDI